MTSTTPTSRPSPENEFVLTRVFNAPREIVFKAWTDPKQMARWWGPKSFTNPVCQMDVRPGGKMRIVMRGPDGKEYPFKGVFLEVVEPERLVYTNDSSEHGQEWHNLVNPDREKGEPITTVTFEDESGKTRLTVRMVFPSTKLRDGYLRGGLSQGFEQSLDRLEDVLRGA